MIYLLLFITVILAVFFACRLFLLRKAIAKTAGELREITSCLTENRIVRLPVQDRELELLLEAINANLTAIRQEHNQYMRKERLLKEQIENISHDLRTPLTAVLGYLKLLDEAPLDPVDAEYLEIAIRKSETLQTLISQFYELSCVTSDAFTIKTEPVDAARILRETCLEHYAQLEEKQLLTDFHLPGNEIMIPGEPDALKRIFSNLLQNAVRYAEGCLSVRYQTDDEKKTVCFIFSNDISPELILPDPSRLFDRFYMQEQSRSRGGTGLGLTISKTLAERMGGQMEAAYSLESGQTVFSISAVFPAQG